MIAPRSPGDGARRARWPAAGLALLLGFSVASGVVPRAGASDESEGPARLERMQAEIRRLQQELAELGSREAGVLGELERLGAELRLRRAERLEIEARLNEVRGSLAARGRRLEELETVQEQRQRYLAFRLREIYKAGPDRTLRMLIGGERLDEYWTGLRYAAFLSERDGKVLAQYRETAVRLEEERSGLQLQEQELVKVNRELTRSEARLASSRRKRETVLEGIRQDRSRREIAVSELQAAADALGGVVDSLDSRADLPTLDIRKFQGLLDWPSSGSVLAGFGTVVHPRFKTRVPHPGLDIEGEIGGSIQSVFDGRVVFASWMRGYGLTTIVDHGDGLMSIYAHASVLLVEPGERVSRGEQIGKIGDTGSLQGPLLYFELRAHGSPVDPRLWLRPR